MPDDTAEASRPRNTTDFSDLSALIFNCTLKRSPKDSHTDTLLDVMRRILDTNEVRNETIRLVDHPVPPGVSPDMTEQGWNTDAWPELWKKVERADIVIIGTPIWLGQISSEAKKLIERLYAHSGDTNEKGQFVFYGKTGGCVVTGNEDGIKHCSMEILYSLQHIGFTLPPQADSGWVGDAGPGPSYGDQKQGGGRVGFDNDYTLRTATFATWNLMHMARMLKDAGGFPAHGNQKSLWEAGCRFDSPDPEQR